MAGTARKAVKQYGPKSAALALQEEHNKLVTDIEVIRSALSAGGVVAVTELVADHATFKVTVDQLETLAEELGTDHATTKVTVDQLETLAEELGADHATTKVTVDQMETLIEELGADHATFKVTVDELETLAEELGADHATTKTAVDSLKTLADELKADFNLIRTGLLNGTFMACGLAEGTNANTIKFANAFSFSIAGQLYLKAITDNIAMTAAAEQAISTFCMYLVTLDSGGTVTITKGTELGTDTAVLPARPANQSVVAAFKIATDGATTFTSGTTDLGAVGITETYYDLMFPNSGAEAPTAIAAADASAGPATLAASIAITSGPATLTAGTAITAGPETLTAGTAITSGPATLTAGIAITSGPATLTATAPSGTAVNEAADLLAATVNA